MSLIRSEEQKAEMRKGEGRAWCVVIERSAVSDAFGSVAPRSPKLHVRPQQFLLPPPLPCPSTCLWEVLRCFILLFNFLYIHITLFVRFGGCHVHSAPSSLLKFTCSRTFLISDTVPPRARLPLSYSESSFYLTTRGQTPQPASPLHHEVYLRSCQAVRDYSPTRETYARS